MSELHLMSAKCPGCQTTIRVKSHSTSKTVNCPKCKTPVSLGMGGSSTSVAATEEDLPEAQLWSDASEPPSGAKRNNALGLVVVVVLVLGAIGLYFLLRGNNDGISPTSIAHHSGSTASSNEETTTNLAKETEKTQEQTKQPPANDKAAAAKAALDRAKARVASLERQQQDWL